MLTEGVVEMEPWRKISINTYHLQNRYTKTFCITEFTPYNVIKNLGNFLFSEKY